jgi:hypothetical protein
MNAAFSTSQTSPSAFGHARQPNEFDLQRVIRLLEKRVRYRYVTPMVEICDSGYRIQSACCSRNIDAEGGVIDIAWLEFDAATDRWNLYYKNHTSHRWQFHQTAQRLDEVMDCLNEDPARVFWQ